MSFHENCALVADKIWLGPGGSDVATHRSSRRSSRKSFWGATVGGRALRRTQEMQDWNTSRKVLASMLESERFELLMGLIIVSNLGLMVVQVDYEADCFADTSHRGRCTELEFVLLNIMFLSIYITEVCVRIYTYRRAFWTNGWNLLELAIVVTGVVDMGLAASPIHTGPQKLVMQLFRMGRLARGIRLLAFFPQLNRIILLLRGALTPLLWGFVLIVFMNIFWSIIAVEFINPIVGGIHFDPEEDDCKEVYSTVWHAMLLFFQTHVAEDNWGQCIMPIIRQVPGTVALFLPATITVQLGLLNVILTAVVDSAVSAREQDNLQRAVENRQLELSSLEDWRGLFKTMDLDNDGQVSLRECLDAFDVEEDVREYLMGLNIDRDDLRQIFNLMDSDGDGDLSYHELVNTFVKAQSQDQRVYMMTLKLQAQQILHTLHQQGEALQGLYSTMNKSVDQRGVESTSPSHSPRQLAKTLDTGGLQEQLDVTMSIAGELDKSRSSTDEAPGDKGVKSLPPFCLQQVSCSFSSVQEASNKPLPPRTSVDPALIKAAARSMTTELMTDLSLAVTTHSSGYETAASVEESIVPPPEVNAGLHGPSSAHSVPQAALVLQVPEEDRELPVKSEPSPKHLSNNGKQALTAKGHISAFMPKFQSRAAPARQQTQGVTSPTNQLNRVDLDNHQALESKVAERSAGQNKNMGMMYSDFETMAPIWTTEIRGQREQQKEPITDELSRSLPQLNLSSPGRRLPDSSRNSSGSTACKTQRIVERWL